MKKYDVFISYSRKDTAVADKICAAFDRNNISYFIDRQGIAGGAEFPESID
ncbi:MAG: toll/interleukin-1 receptor domain-containing protein [Bacteroidales bacterium]|nr:toll/interleukin-1 receptor domain-containing protein [Bacteroidales bacterium]